MLLSFLPGFAGASFIAASTIIPPPAPGAVAAPAALLLSPSAVFAPSDGGGGMSSFEDVSVMPELPSGDFGGWLSPQAIASEDRNKPA